MTTQTRLSRRCFTLLTLAILTLMMVSAAAAQAPSSGEQSDETPPYREVERRAPEREPVVLQRTTTDQGNTRTILQLPVVADAYIASERPGQNFGEDSLFLGYNLAGIDNFGAQRVLVRFETSLIPEDAVINSATMRLYLIFSSPEDDEPMGTVLRRLDSAWDEDLVTWNGEPQWTPVDDTAEVGSEPGWYEWDIPAVVQTWVDDASGNYGIEIIGDERIQQRERAFYARETQTDFFPQLIVDYTVPDDDQAPEVEVNPLPQYVGRDFEVTWSGTDEGGSGIDHYDVQYRVDGGAWIDWLLDTTATEATFANGVNGSLYEFRARGVDDAGNVEPFGAPEASTTVDSLPPAVTVDPLPARFTTNTFLVSWSGTDSGGSGIQYYDVRYRVNGSSWALWQSGTTDVSATFTAGVDGQYEFEARGVDERGQVEPFSGEAQASTQVDTEAPFIVPALYLPVIEGS